MPEWENVVQGMIDRFGSDAQTVGVLLAFLKCLVEESGNPRIALSVGSSLTKQEFCVWELELIYRTNKRGSR